MPDQAPTTPLGAPADGPVEGATLVVEAPTAEAALTQLHEQLGADARIVEVRRVARGGIAGFFAREVVELHAAPGAATTGAATTGAVTTGAATPGAATPGAATPGAVAPSDEVAEVATSPIDRLLRAETAADRADTVDFATYLRSQLQAGGPAPTAPTAAAPDAGPALSTHEALIERATAAARLAVQTAAGGTAAGGIVDPATDRVVGTPAADVVRSTAVPEATGSEVVTPEVAPRIVTPEVAAAQVAPPQVVPEVTAPQVTEAVHGTTVAPAAVGTDITEPAPATEPGPAWSVANLIKLGLPAGLVRGLDVAEAADDVAWTAALASALRPVCRPLPSGDSLLVGPRVRGLAGKLRVRLATAGEPIRATDETIGVVTRGDHVDRCWLERARGTRWLHVVVGGSTWRDLLQLDPLAVSWATRMDLCEAVRLATELGLVLGAGPLGRGVQRARPMDVTLAIRDLLPVNAEPTVVSGGEGR